MRRDRLSPLVIFAYNRPVHLKRALNALAASRLAARTYVHVFADGPRGPGDVDMVRRVREVLKEEARAGRFASFDVRASNINRGLASSVISGVDQVLNSCGRAIVLEDDLLVSLDFLEFMNDCLAFYEDDASVGAVTGFSPLRRLPAHYDKDVFLACRNSSYGWGTWSRVWSGVDWSAGALQDLNLSLRRRRAFNSEGNDRFDRLRRQMAGRIDSWSIRFGLSLFVRGLGTVYPSVNRVGNIGYDGSGMHSGAAAPINDEFHAAPYQLAPVSLDPEIQAAFRRTYSGTLSGRTMRDVLTLFPRLSGWLGR